MTHRLNVRVYYEDTDLAGIVYYANYLKFIERGRSEWLRDIGLDQARLKDETGLVFAVRRVEADYLKPAKFDDLLVVTTDTASSTPARAVLEQTVQRNGETLFTARVTIVCLGSSGRPARLPSALVAALGGAAND